MLFVIDVDNYREINQIFGRTVGNTLIKDMAHKIKASFRNSDIVGRIGGDEFQFRSGEQENAETSNRAKPNAIVTNGENVDRELLNLVSVFVYDMQKPQMTMTNSWTNLGKIYDRDIIPRSWKFFENEPVGVFVELKSVLENEQIDEETKRAFDRSL